MKTALYDGVPVIWEKIGNDFVVIYAHDPERKAAKMNTKEAPLTCSVCGAPVKPNRTGHFVHKEGVGEGCPVHYLRK